MTPPLTLSDMLRGMSEQMHALYVCRASIGPMEMFDLARTLGVCANAARDLEHQAQPQPVQIPPQAGNVIPFPARRA